MKFLKTAIKVMVCLAFLSFIFILCACNSGGSSNNYSDETTTCYVITWKNYDGSILYTDKNAKKGDMPSYKGSTPTKPSDQRYNYTFSGWSPSITKVTSNKTYTAQYNNVSKEFTVTWKNYNGDILEIDTDVPRGSEPSYDGQPPTKPSDETYSYTFSGWTPSITPVEKDATYTATYTSKENPIEISSINFTQQDVYLFVGDSTTISYRVNPSKYSDAITFKSYDPSIVTIDGTTIIGNSSGTTKVIGYGPDGTKSTFNVYVIEEMVLTLSANDSLNGYISACTNSYGYLIGNKEENISGRLYYYKNYTDTTKNAYKLKFYSLDTSYFEVDETTGKIQFKDKKGIAKLKLILYSPISSKEIEIKIGISEAVEVTSWSFSKTQYSLNVGDTTTISGTYSPSNANVGPLTYTSSDDTIAEVDANGTITAKSIGTCDITAYSKTIKQYYHFTVTVSGKYATTITGNNLSVAPSETKKISVSYTPSNANVGKKITYHSNNEEIAFVDNEGNVTGLREGTCQITLTLENEYKTTINVTVIESVYPTSISLSNSSLTLKPNATSTLTASISPLNANVCLSKTWTSSNTSVAIVSNGKVKAIAPGTANICVSLDNGIKAYCQVTVLDYTRPSSITLSKTSINIDPKLAQTITATINPSDTDKDNKLTWSSTNEEVAIVNAGVITAKAPGTCKVIVQTENGIFAECDVTVNEYTYATSVSLTSTSISVDPNRETAVGVNLSPSNANAGLEITWTSSDTSIAKIENGIIIGVTPGTCTITAKLNNGAKADCTVTVNDYIYAETITITSSSLSITKESTSVVTTTYLPATANVGTKIIFTSSDDTIATVDATGIITGKSVGECIITAKLENGYTKTCIVNVLDYIYAESITLNKTSATLNPSQSIALTYIVVPSNAQKGKNVTWTSSDNSIAIVSEEGIVKAIDKGTCTIIAKLENGSTATCTITVNGVSPIIYDAITKENYSNSLYINCTKGESIQLESNTKVTYSSSDSNIVYVSNNMLTCIGLGNCIITATNSSGDSSKFKVNVYDCSLTYDKTTNIVDYECLKNNNSGEYEKGKTISELTVSLSDYKFINGKTLCLVLDVNKMSGGFESSNISIEIYDSNDNLICIEVAKSEEKMLFGENVEIEKQIDLSDYFADSFTYNFKIKIVDSPIY